MLLPREKNRAELSPCRHANSNFSIFLDLQRFLPGGAALYCFWENCVVKLPIVPRCCAQNVIGAEDQRCFTSPTPLVCAYRVIFRQIQAPRTRL
jgi:hypothetical protein